MKKFECSTTFEYKSFVKRKISYICYMIRSPLIHETVLVVIIELEVHLPFVDIF